MIVVANNEVITLIVGVRVVIVLGFAGSSFADSHVPVRIYLLLVRDCGEFFFGAGSNAICPGYWPSESPVFKRLLGKFS